MESNVYYWHRKCFTLEMGEFLGEIDRENKIPDQPISDQPCTTLMVGGSELDHRN